MKIGDLVKLKCPTTRDFNKAFLITELYGSGHPWLKVLGSSAWQRITDFEVINENR